MSQNNYFNKLKYGHNPSNVDYYKAIDWNSIEDEIDKEVWEKLVAQFWTDTRVPVSNDLDDWRKLSQAERDLIGKVFGGLTLLDTMQSEDGVLCVFKDARSQHEQAVLSNIFFIESMHAKSYSTIFSTLNTKAEIEAIFEWTNNNIYVQNKAKIVNNWYQNGNAYQKKAASVLLESFLFYSGFYTPLYYLGTNRMPNTAEIIKLILRDESVHGVFLGYKAQKHLADMSEEEAEELREWTYDLAWELYENEEKYTDMLYKEVGWEDGVKAFLRYNCNKALMNLGLDPLFTETAEDVNPIVMNGISTGTSNHDFFSQVGNGYLVGQAEPMNDDDYLIGLNK